MNKIIPLITTANGNLKEQKPMLLEVAKEVTEFIFPRFKVDWDINVLFTNREPNTLIPEDGTGGQALYHDFIKVTFDENKATKHQIFGVACHELGHAIRWGKNEEFMKTLFDGMISEGIATHFEAKAHKIHNSTNFFLDTILERSDNENQKILDKLRGQLYNEKYDYQGIFIDGNKLVPRWTGYSVGYYIVKKYMKQTGKKLEDVFALDYEKFRSAI